MDHGAPGIIAFPDDQVTESLELVLSIHCNNNNCNTISCSWLRKSWMMSSRKCTHRKSLSKWWCLLRPVNLDLCLWTSLPLIVVSVYMGIVGGAEAWRWDWVTPCFWFCSVCSHCSQSSWIILCLLLWWETGDLSWRRIQCKLDGECGLSKEPNPSMY